jgi:hypothetical protein
MAPLHTEIPTDLLPDRRAADTGTGVALFVGALVAVALLKELVRAFDSSAIGTGARDIARTDMQFAGAAAVGSVYRVGRSVLGRT